MNLACASYQSSQKNSQACFGSQKDLGAIPKRQVACNHPVSKANIFHKHR